MNKIKSVFIQGGVVMVSITLLAILFLQLKPISHPVIVENLEDGLQPGAKKSLSYVNFVRSYPEKQLAKSGFAQAHIRAKEMPKEKRRKVLEWEAIGPKNIGGRTLALAINPSNPETVFAGSASGGLWKSNTGGSGLNAWEYVRTGFPVLGVGAIAIDPQKPNTMFIGTGENYGSAESFPGIGFIRTTRGSYGIGILKSEDGGETWEKSLDWALNQRTGVQKIQVNPLRSNSVWAATTEGLFRSNNGGETWENVHNVSMATDVIINPQDTSIVYVAHGGMGSLGQGLYRSKNAGSSFEKMGFTSAGGPSSFLGKIVLSISESNPNIVMASVGNSDGTITDDELNKTWLMRTLNGGDTWSLVSNFDYSRVQGWYAHAIAISPVNENKVWAVGQPFAIYTSDNGGIGLQEHPNISTNPPGENDPDDIYPFLSDWADYHDIVYHPTNPDIIYFINDGGIFRTTDGGNTFENCNSGYQTTQFYNGVSNSNTNGNLILGGLQDNSSVIYDGNTDWRRVWAGDGAWTMLDQSNNNNAAVSAQFGQATFSDDLYTETKLGDIYFRPSFEQFPTNTTNFITPMVLSPADNSTAFMAGESVFSASFGVDVWVEIGNKNSLDGNPMSVMAASYQNPNVLYIGSMPKDFNSPRSHIYRTDNKGNAWVDITGELPNKVPTDLVVDPTDDRRVFVTFGGFGGSHVFKSENGGDSWIDISEGLPDIPTWSAVVDPLFPNHIYVGNEVGIFLSKNAGETWENISDGLPDAIFAIDLVISQSNRKLRVATHGNGVYQIDLASIVQDELESNKPTRVMLKQNYPNPFNPSTNISFELSETAQVRLDVFDLTGKIVATLLNERRNSGQHTVQFNAKNLASGVYLYQLNVDGQVLTKKMTLIK